MILGTAGIVFWGHAERSSQRSVLSSARYMLGSLIIYFWAGMLSTSAVQVDCPECGKLTKMLGKTDRCMFCHTILTMDPNKANTMSPPVEPSAPPAAPSK